MKNRKLRIGLVLLAVMGILVVTVVIYGLSILNHPETASVEIGQAKSSQTSYTIDLTPQAVTGKYVAFHYPKGVPLISRSLASPISLEDFAFYTKDVYSWTLAVDVTRTPTGNLSESSSYNVRKQNPAEYSESEMLINGQQIHVMTDTLSPAGFGKVAYLTHGTMLATVSLLGSDASGTAPLQTSFAMVLNSWHWL